jgi:transcriptional regulator with XRE-family HTH domain
MTQGDLPTVARRCVRLVLRESREAAGLTQQQVAEDMEWSLSKVIRIENGDVSIAPNDLRPLLALLGVNNRAQVADLLATAAVAGTRQRQAWYQAADVRARLTDGLRRPIEYEAQALSIHSYSVFHMPLRGRRPAVVQRGLRHPLPRRRGRGGRRDERGPLLRDWHGRRDR